MKRGFTMGTFDRFHAGHLELIRRADLLCDHLTVGVIDDALVTARKGREPYDSLHVRAARLACISYVNAVTKVEDCDLGALHAEHGFDVLVVGDDWKGKLADDQRWQTVYLPRTPGISTTEVRGDVRFPLVPALNAGAVTLCLLGIYWPAGLVFAGLAGAGYAIAYVTWGRIRVYDWLNRASEEPASWA